MVRRLTLVIPFVLATLAVPSLPAQPVRLIKDVRPGALGCFEKADGSVIDTTPPAVLDDVFLFPCDDGVHGFELWKSDGTESGTALLKDVNPGAASAFPLSHADVANGMVAAADVVFFVADDGVHGYELWKTDGTSAGTTMVTDGCPGSCSYLPDRLTVAGPLLYFKVDGGAYGLGSELWRSDGTEGGTYLVKDIRPGSAGSSPGHLTAFGDRLVFAADDGVHGDEPWISDGTEAGTQIIRDVVSGSWGSFPKLFTEAGDCFFFFLGDPGLTKGLWKSDGTEAGSVLVRGNLDAFEALSLGALLLFYGRDVTIPLLDPDFAGDELWRSDGAEAGTWMVEDLAPGKDSSYINYFTHFDGKVFFRATSGLWKTDGSAAGTGLVKELSSIYYPTALTDLLLLHASDPDRGGELWRSNGEGAGTVMVADVLPGADSSSPRWLRPAGDDLFFVADDGVHGFEPWLLPRSATLHDQTGAASGSADSSQEFEPVYSSYDCLAADDFVVPAADWRWDLGEVVVGGLYDPIGGPMPFVNVEIYQDSSGLPGAVVCSYDGLAAGADFTDHEGDLKIVLPSACPLPSGTYWLMVQADMDFDTHYQWYWSSSTLPWLSRYLWINPGDGSGTGCTTWSAGCGGDVDRPDLLFALRTPPGCTLGASDLVLAGETLSGSERIEACRTITAGGGTAIATGSDVTLRAGRRIVLESGFSVGAGCSLALEIDPALATPDP